MTKLYVGYKNIYTDTLYRPPNQFMNESVGHIHSGQRGISHFSQKFRVLCIGQISLDRKVTTVVQSPVIATSRTSSVLQQADHIFLQTGVLLLFQTLLFQKPRYIYLTSSLSKAFYFFPHICKLHMHLLWLHLVGERKFICKTFCFSTHEGNGPSYQTYKLLP